MTDDADRDPCAPDHVRAHRHSIRHRDELARSHTCGCFYCLTTFVPADIEQWIDHDQTALCPRCGIDAVIGDASGYPTSRWFLDDMRRYWF